MKRSELDSHIQKALFALVSLLTTAVLTWGTWATKAIMTTQSDVRLLMFKNGISLVEPEPASVLSPVGKLMLAYPGLWPLPVPDKKETPNAPEPTAHPTPDP